MWLDGAYINMRDAEILSAQAKKYVPPLFTEADVYEALKHIEEYDSGLIHKITDFLSIRYLPDIFFCLNKQKSF